MQRSLGVICARGGSKGFPNKNITDLLGKPLIWYSIQQALGSKLTKCLVSTDSPEIAEIVKEYAPEMVQFLRPVELSTDDAPIDGALIHALEFAEDKWNTIYDYVVLLPNSAPLRTSEDIDACLELLEEFEEHKVISVTEIEHPYELLRERNGYLERLPEYCGLYRRQDCPPLYLGNGIIRAFDRDLLLSSGSIWAGKTIPYVMPRYRSVEIHSQEDLNYAAKMLTV